MSIPRFSSGLLNYYEAALTNEGENAVYVLTLGLDAFCAGSRVRLIKIDAEGHEAFVLAGIRSLVLAHHPVLIVETSRQEVIESLSADGYSATRLPDSPNILFIPRTY